MISKSEEIKKDTELNKFSFPPAWKDNLKMKELMSAFHLRHYSPSDYDAKMVFWSELIKNHCKHFGKANFSTREMQLQFMRGEQIPACLADVVANMEQLKEIRLRSEYEYDPLNSWSGWLVNSFVKRPLAKSWLKLKHSIIAEDMSARALVEWVHVEVMQNLCDEIDKKVLHTNRGKFMHLDEFKSLCKDSEVQVHENCLGLCLITLEVRKLIGIDYKTDRQSRSVHLIKIPAHDKDSVVITDADRGKHSLYTTRTSLLNQLEELEDEIKVNDNKARQYVKENKRQLAKTYLRKRNLLEKSHERRSVALHNIETLLTNMDEAQHNGVVIDAYKTGSQTLKEILNNSGLVVDNVDEVLSDVRETLEQHTEVQNVLSQSRIETADKEDEDEVERELRELMGEPEPVQLISNNNKPEVVINDKDLIAMLDSLEVEDGTISVCSSRTLDSIYN